MARRYWHLILLFCLLAVPRGAWAQDAPFEYRLSFPTPEHRWMQVETRFTNLPEGTAEIRMSRTSPGRYALHEFAKNVFDVKLADGSGRALEPTRPNLHQWNVTGHGGTIVLSYKVYGDRIDGTYLSVDATHAHLNMPATVMFVRGQLDRPARVTFVRPPGREWRVATQLLPTDDPLVFTAPSIHYLMDSPAEFSDFTLRTFTVGDQAGQGAAQTFRIALHHDGTDADADQFARDVEKVVRESMRIFGELPRFDGGTYTFLADYLPWASGDGMEHRNSTVLTSSGEPAFTQFGSSSGGWTAAGSMPYLPAREDPYDGWAGNPVHAWKIVLADTRLEQAWPAVGDLRRIEITSRDGNGAWGGRVGSITLTGSAGQVTVSGDSFRSALGLRSTWLTFTIAPG